MKQAVDPIVSRAKFDRELAQYRKLERDYLRRGWLLVEAEFPCIFVVFIANQLKPAPVICGVNLDFTNYDLAPPSVVFADPFNREPYKRKDLGIQMIRALPQGGILDMVQAHSDEKPFLCLPGVAEYHRNPAHTGDHWLLHRRSGEGSLFFILDQIWKYGVQPIKTPHLQIEIKSVGWVRDAAIPL